MFERVVHALARSARGDTESTDVSKFSSERLQVTAIAGAGKYGGGFMSTSAWWADPLELETLTAQWLGGHLIRTVVALASLTLAVVAAVL